MRPKRGDVTYKPAILGDDSYDDATGRRGLAIHLNVVIGARGVEALDGGVHVRQSQGRAFLQRHDARKFGGRKRLFRGGVLNVRDRLALILRRLSWKRCAQANNSAAKCRARVRHTFPIITEGSRYCGAGWVLSRFGIPTEETAPLRSRLCNGLNDSRGLLSRDRQGAVSPKRLSTWAGYASRSGP